MKKAVCPWGDIEEPSAMRLKEHKKELKKLKHFMKQEAYEREMQSEVEDALKALRGPKKPVYKE